MNTCCYKCKDDLDGLGCDNPQCPCHVKESKPSEWEKIDKQIGQAHEDGYKEGLTASHNSLLEEIEKEVEKEKVDIRPEITVWLRGDRKSNEAHNQALDSIIGLIKSKKQ